MFSLLRMPSGLTAEGIEPTDLAAYTKCTNWGCMSQEFTDNVVY